MRTLKPFLSRFVFASAGAAAIALMGVIASPAQAQNGSYYCFPERFLTDSVSFEEAYDCPTPADIDNSLRQIGDDRVKNLVTHNRLAAPLLGATEQINCGDCFRGFAMAGSFSAGFNGRKNLTERLSVLGGLSFNEFDSKSTKTTRAPIFALGLRYDLADWGTSRPFFQVAGSLSPNERVRTTRVVLLNGTPAAVSGATDATTYALHARAGWVYRVSPVGEFAAYVDLSHTGQRFSAYTEKGDPNLLPLTYESRTTSSNVVRAVVQHTHLLTPSIEVHVGAGIAHGFGSKSGLSASSQLDFYGVFTGSAKNTTWAEVDARVGFRVAKGVVIDAFALTTFGPDPVGNTIHGGLGLRYLY